MHVKKATLSGLSVSGYTITELNTFKEGEFYDMWIMSFKKKKPN